MMKMLKIIRRRIYFWLVEHREKWAPTAKQTLEEKWYIVKLVHEDGPCIMYMFNGHTCKQCEEYELATAILNDEKPILEWV